MDLLMLFEIESRLLDAGDLLSRGGSRSGLGRTPADIFRVLCVVIVS